MTTFSETRLNPGTPDRQALIRLAEEIDAQAGVAHESNMSIVKLRDLMKADGVRPEDNGASREAMRVRYGDDWDKE